MRQQIWKLFRCSLLREASEGLSYNPLFVGPGAYKFMLEKGLIWYEGLYACSGIRIFNYLRGAIDEVGFSAAEDGQIRDPEGVFHSSDDILSLQHAPSGYELHMLVDGWCEIAYRLADEMGIDRPDG